MINDIKIPNKPVREFVAENLIVDSWEKIQPLFDDLLERKINNVNELEKWMSDRSELAAVLEEDLAWRYIKMNIDTDLQWGFTTGTRDYFAEKTAYLQSQIGNPEGDDVPNKKYYDPRKWLREGELTFISRLKRSFEDLNNINRNA